MGSEWALVTKEKCKIKEIKVTAESNGIYDNTRSITQLATGTEYAIPVTPAARQLFSCCSNDEHCATPPFKDCILSNSVTCHNSKLWKHNKNKFAVMNEVIKQLGLNHGLSEYEANELASHNVSWIRHGDLIVLPKAFFDNYLWKKLIMSAGDEVWKAIARGYECSRIILQEKISNNRYRSPVNQLVLGEDGWVSHIDNGVWYVFDVTRTMFSQGNITEKMRMAALQCEGETIVDLFAGIGYFTLPLLIHAKASHVYACEWNPAAIEGLKRGLEKNRVSSNRCTVIQGDNNKVAPRGIADRVILGLIPSSEDSWVTACSCIKPTTGGWLHIHGNITVAQSVKLDDDDDSVSNNETVSRSTSKSHTGKLLDKALIEWSESTKTKIAEIFTSDHTNLIPAPTNQALSWNVVIKHIECVKSYAPCVYHAVVDLHCLPTY